MPNKKILVLASTYPRWADDIEPSFVAKLCCELSKNYEVHVLAPHYEGALQNEVLNGITVFRYRYAPSPLERLAYCGGILENLKKSPYLFLLVPFFLLAQLIQLHLLNRRHNYSLIHAHWIIPQGFVAAIYKKFLCPTIPLIVTSHGGDLFALKGRVLSRLKVWVLKQTSHITVVSSVMKKYAVGLGVPPSKITIRSMGVDLVDSFQPFGKAELNSADLIFVGRLVEKKGVEYLIKAFVKVRAKHPKAKLKVVGDGPLKKGLMALSARLELDSSVEFVGGVSNAEIPLLLSNASIAVIPSIIAKSGDQEGLGLVIVEALGCECAVVASDLPAIHDVIVHGETGVLVEPGNSMKLAECLIDALNNPETMKDRAIKGREFVMSHFDWGKVGVEYSDIIEQNIAHTAYDKH